MIAKLLHLSESPIGFGPIRPTKWLKRLWFIVLLATLLLLDVAILVLEILPIRPAQVFVVESDGTIEECQPGAVLCEDKVCRLRWHPFFDEQNVTLRLEGLVAENCIKTLFFYVARKSPGCVLLGDHHKAVARGDLDSFFQGARTYHRVVVGRLAQIPEIGHI